MKTYIVVTMILLALMLVNCAGDSAMWGGGHSQRADTVRPRVRGDCHNGWTAVDGVCKKNTKVPPAPTSAAATPPPALFKK